MFLFMVVIIRTVIFVVNMQTQHDYLSGCDFKKIQCINNAVIYQIFIYLSVCYSVMMGRMMSNHIRKYISFHLSFLSSFFPLFLPSFPPLHCPP